MKSTTELESELAHILQTEDSSTGYTNEDDIIRQSNTFLPPFSLTMVVDQLSREIQDYIMSTQANAAVSNFRANPHDISTYNAGFHLGGGG